jgi:hypothetical protein
MGCLPSAETEAGNNFLSGLPGGTADDLTKEEGMVLRYQQTGKGTLSATDVTDRYSEIGFYRRKTRWPSTDFSYVEVPFIPDRKDSNGKELSVEE